LNPVLIISEMTAVGTKLPFAAVQKCGRLLRCCGPHLLAMSLSGLDPQWTMLLWHAALYGTGAFKTAVAARLC